MRRLRIVWTPLAALASLGCFAPGAGAPEPERAKKGNAPIEVSDVALTRRRDAGRRRHPHAAVRRRVALAQHKTWLSLAKTDLQGRFRFAGVKGGVYQLLSSGQVRFVRAWTAEAAPPAARPLALMVVGSEVVRGQMPLEDFFASDAVIITGLVAAMIAIPIAVHNSGGKDKPASP